jgi:hypothetical protein
MRIISFGDVPFVEINCQPVRNADDTIVVSVVTGIGL